ncbi:glycosyltransferase family 2 protein [Candidatus Methanoplasma termitum]|uniref:glycosyltransferase family 2 protein n=1 Tax=Candidatus Methanoplasma termitum TaxID=1577791 RepID=UPI00130E9DF1|nr:glycosyltransferase family 2 protein [Candidatus Methanoplasma termitum]
MKASEKVSVIIPVFNGAAHIRSAFDVLSKQTYDNFETIFVVDKKTSDDSLKIMEEEKGRLSDVKVIVQQGDTKLGGARNEGLQASEGEIVWFFDVDDVAVPELLSETVRIMAEKNADVVMFNFIRTRSADVKPPSGEFGIDEMSRNEAIAALLHLELPVTAWSKIIRKKLLTDNGIEFSFGYAEDVWHTYNLVNKSEKICFCEKPLYLYIQNEGSICNTDKNRNIRGKAEIDRYAKLEELFSGDEDIIGVFKKRSALIRIRSAVHMDKASFMEYARSEDCRTMLNANLHNSVSPEVVLFKVAPSLYYSFVEYYLRKIYYKDNKCFRKPKKA